ncbi:hypothetical protein NCCP2331_08490 [Sporosarcina sp. NCCP-2331]|nr:hypothetical protein NCCP2331_08490 [Sporosarcina sp. NCCP-2331]GLB54806.1 hypothetical protein NCCP2378_05910 [Sporosarcina sp. NCCP-2378]
MAQMESPIAKLSEEELHALNRLEKELNVALVAYENTSTSST